MTGAEREAQRTPFHCGEQRAVPWLQRAEVAAELLATVPHKGPVPPLLADIGCGDRKLYSALAARGLPFRYHGYDLLPQHADVQRFDVRTESLPRRHAVVVMLGVIEYLADLPGVLARLAPEAPHLLLSHAVRQADGYSAARLAELGWIVHLAAEELEALLQQAGFAVRQRRMTPDGRTLLLLCASLCCREDS